jgi:prepilin-type N-terminal cleavage/methylation domain-containing protein
MRRIRRDAGFTLIELLITIVIMGVITIPLANFVINYFVNTSTTTGRLSESHDEQLAATYFASDVASVGSRGGATSLQQSIWPGSFPAGSCGSSASAANQVLLLTWDNITWTGSAEAVRTDAVAYVKAVASGETQLRRIYCQGSTQVSNIVVVHNLDAATAPVVTCPSTCTAAAVPATVSLQLRIAEASGSGQPFTVTLTGQRRQT